VDKLTVAELDLLGRILEKPELQPFFFRKVRGLKWFEALSEKGFFDPKNNPPPAPAKEKGYVTVPIWHALEYLVSSSDELMKPDNLEAARRVVGIVLAATRYAKENKFSNYRTWWQFSKLIQHVPPELIQIADIETIDYWLDDAYDRSLVAIEIGSKWLPTLLDGQDRHRRDLALKLFESVFQIRPEEKDQPRSRGMGALRYSDWHAERISHQIARKAGTTLGIAAVKLLQDRLESLLVDANNDKWSSVWRRAIEDHEQDQYADNAADVIVSAYRDCLLGFLRNEPDSSRAYLATALESPYETVKRIAVFAVNEGYSYLSELADHVIQAQFFTSNLRHEVWHLLKARYGDFSEQQKERVLKIVLSHVEYRDDGKVHEGASSYWRAVWLASIKGYGPKIAQLYDNEVALAGSEPEHPDFSSYMTAGFVTHESPYSIEDLLALPVNVLVEQLNSYKGGSEFRGPSVEGLAKTVHQLVKTDPIRYATHLASFLQCDLAYVYEVIEAYQELWAQKASLPWDDIWSSLLKFIHQLLAQEQFWSPENAKQRSSFVANRHWIIGAIGRLIEAGVKSDEHAFGERLLPDAEEVIVLTLKRQEGEDFKDGKDAVSIAINSPRGRALEALVNLTLRSCRLADKTKQIHSETWKHFEPLFELELRRAATKEYEFATLVANYLPNFLYMSKDWTLSNLEEIFDQQDEKKWRCAMQGYAYVNMIYPEVYTYLRDHHDFIRALDDETISDRVQEKVIQNIIVGYLHDYDSLDNPTAMITQVLSRRKYSELSHLIWFVWTLREVKDPERRTKVLALWARLISAIDKSTSEGKKLASKLCTWIVFIDEVDERNKRLFLDVAQYADEDHSAFGVLENIARISEKQPVEAYEFWSRVLEGSRPDYPDDAIRKSLQNIAAKEGEGIRNAKKIVDQYIKGGNERPAEILAEIVQRAI
jgi:hypothetical protein